MYNIHLYLYIMIWIFLLFNIYNNYIHFIHIYHYIYISINLLLLNIILHFWAQNLTFSADCTAHTPLKQINYRIYFNFHVIPFAIHFLRLSSHCFHLQFEYVQSTILYLLSYNNNNYNNNDIRRTENLYE